MEHLKQRLIDAALITALGIAVAFAIAASINLDEDFTPPATQDAAQSAECARDAGKCRQALPSDEAVRDPRVQKSLRRLCATGQTWACKLVIKTEVVL